MRSPAELGPDVRHHLVCDVAFIARDRRADTQKRTDEVSQRVTDMLIGTRTLERSSSRCLPARGHYGGDITYIGEIFMAPEHQPSLQDCFGCFRDHVIDECQEGWRRGHYFCDL